MQSKVSRETISSCLFDSEIIIALTSNQDVIYSKEQIKKLEVTDFLEVLLSTCTDDLSILCFLNQLGKLMCVCKSI